eukprot:TRINITY_DN5995_c0_g1_i3.p1 TRINITY_DN5995_c0_g1~~TRINITY_DN5995_c0_g1_i3.p1  ORF type:complete len:547 (-),score=157.15 TRINITY_DN5995_c0_g1_i3:348-1988(-)
MTEGNERRRPVRSDSLALLEKLDWREDVLKATRGCIITLKNESRLTLTRENYRIPHGEWRKFPPETLFPNTTVEWATSSRGVMTGTEAEVIYKDFKGQQYRFYWNHPYIGTRTRESDGPDNCHIASTDSVTSNTLKTVQLYSINFTLQSNLTPPEAPSSPTKPQMNPAMMLSIKEISISAEQEKQLRGPSVSVLISIKNNTSETFLIKRYNIQSGKWTALPPDQLNSKSEYQFATKSDGINVVTTGNVSYTVKDCGKHEPHLEEINLMWSNRLARKPEFSAKIHNDENRYVVECHPHGGSHSKITYFIRERSLLQSVFGSPLSEDNSYEFIHDIVHHLMENVGHDDSILMARPALKEVQEIRRLIDTGAAIEYSQFKLGSSFYVIKMFLRENVEPLIPSSMHPDMARSNDPEKLKIVISKLPLLNVTILELICRLLYVCCFDPAEQSVDAQKAINTGVVFGPILFRYPMNDLASHRTYAHCTSLMATHYETIFERRARTNYEEAKALEQSALQMEQESEHLSQQVHFQLENSFQLEFSRNFQLEKF